MLVTLGIRGLNKQFTYLATSCVVFSFPDKPSLHPGVQIAICLGNLTTCRGLTKNELTSSQGGVATPVVS